MKQLFFLLSLVSWILGAQGIPNVIRSIPLNKADCTDTSSVNDMQVLTNNPGTGISYLFDSNQNSGLKCPSSIVGNNTAQPKSNCTIQSNSSKINCFQVQDLLLLSEARFSKDVCTEVGYRTPINTYNLLCLYNSSSSSLIGQYTYQIDTTPTPISISDITPLDGKITFDTQNDKNSPNKYTVCYSDTKDIIDGIISNKSNDCGSAQSFTLTDTHVTINNLNNFTPYYFTVSAAGSPPLWVDTQTETPVPSVGFSEAYDGEPNPLSFGCAQTGSSPEIWVLFLLLGLALRKKKYSKTPLVIFALLLSQASSAHTGQVNIEITGSVYKPDLDRSTKSDGSLTRPFYGLMYGDKLLPLMGAGFDVHLLDSFGSLQLGLGLAYTYAGGKALLEDQDGSITNNLSQSPVGMHLLNITPRVTYVLNNWVDSFPLVPYLRAGITTMGYLFMDEGGLDNNNKHAPNKPMGFVLGWEGAAGLMLSLNFLEPKVSGSARANGTYRHIYLKAEAAYAPIDNFKNGLKFSSAWPTVDFPLLLTFGIVFELP